MCFTITQNCIKSIAKTDMVMWKIGYRKGTIFVSPIFRHCYFPKIRELNVELEVIDGQIDKGYHGYLSKPMAQKHKDQYYHTDSSLTRDCYKTIQSFIIPKGSQYYCDLPTTEVVASCIKTINNNFIWFYKIKSWFQWLIA